jgi:hypothetical protein
MSYSLCRGLLKAHPIFHQQVQHTVRWQNPISAHRLTEALLCYNYPVSCPVRLEQLRTLMGRATATWHQHLSEHIHQQNFNISRACDRSTQQLALCNSSRWPKLAREEMVTSSCRGGKLPNPTQMTCAWRSYAQGAGYSTLGMAQSRQERRYLRTFVNIDNVPTDLDGWLSFVQQLPRTGYINGGVIVLILAALVDMDTLPGRVEEVSAEVSFLVNDARKRLILPANILERASAAVQKHEMLKTEFFQPGSQLFESIQRLMNAAALNAAIYDDAQQCSKMAIVQRRLRMPYESFWDTLCEKGIQPGAIQHASQLLACRAQLALDGLMPPPSSTSWSAMLSAVCKSCHQDDLSNVLPHNIFRPLEAISHAVINDWPAAAAGSPCHDLQRVTSVLLLHQVQHIKNMTAPDIGRICSAANSLKIKNEFTPEGLETFMFAIANLAPDMQAREVSSVAHFLMEQGCQLSSEPGMFILEALVRCLPVMEVDRVYQLLRASSNSCGVVNQECCAAFLSALARVAVVLPPSKVCYSYLAAVKLMDASGFRLDRQITDDLLAAVLRTAHKMSPALVAGTARVFAKMPLPFNSSAGEALLARILEVLEEMDIKGVAQTGWALGRAGVQLPGPACNVFLKSLVRVAPSLTNSPFLLFNFLWTWVMLERQAVIPDRARAVLVQAAEGAISLHPAGRLEREVKLLNELGLEVPDEMNRP